ncbi:MAG TPA: M28 family peptidase [Anaerolineales bacterium]|nr:M28 family peptidase [Anaerolineales bacterium]
MNKRMNRFIVLILTLALALPAQFVLADDISETQGFRKHVTLAGIREHQAALQAISNDNGGNRVSGSAGFDASAQYVYDRMVAAGYNVSFQEFTFNFDGDASAPALEQTSPTPTVYIDGVDYDTMQFSGSGDFTAPLTAVDLLVPSPFANASTSGCEAADFAGFTPGHIALMQRGTCGFVNKAQNAQAAGAVGVIVFNEGNPGRTNLNLGTLGTPQTIPSITTTFAMGQTLRNGVLNGPTGITVRLKVDYFFGPRTTRNVIAETPTGDPNRVIVVGAHLDSVTRGPGINDNGSGSATILEVAEVFASQGRTPRNKLRFMWYGAEELSPGLIGSNFYVANLSQAERDKIELMLNFDMIGSPNFVRFVYDGNNSGGGGAVGPTGSGAIEQMFLEYFASQGLATEPTPFNGRSDYGPFIAPGVDIPAGGLFTGAEGIKTPAQAAVYGGTAGQQYDPCYHLACDTFDNNSNTALDQMSDAVAHSVLLFSKRNFEKNPLVDPVVAGATGSGGGGGLHDHHDESEPN